MAFERPAVQGSSKPACHRPVPCLRATTRAANRGSRCSTFDGLCRPASLSPANGDVGPDGTIAASGVLDRVLEPGGNQKAAAGGTGTSQLDGDLLWADFQSKTTPPPRRRVHHPFSPTVTVETVYHPA